MRNVTLSHLIQVDTRLHTPAYLLLSQLSLMDMMYISTTVPKVAPNSLSSSETITFWGCALKSWWIQAQLLGFMSSDRQVDICCPVHYSGSRAGRAWAACSRECGAAVLPRPQRTRCTYFSFPSAGLHALTTSSARFHPCCPWSVGTRPSVSPQSWGAECRSCCCHSWPSSLPTPGACCHIPGELGHRTDGSCFHLPSHLSLTSLSYATTLSTCTRPHSLHPPAQDKVVAVFHTMITALLNPFIYSLRNREVMGAVRRLLGQGTLVRSPAFRSPVLIEASTLEELLLKIAMKEADPRYLYISLRNRASHACSALKAVEHNFVNLEHNVPITPTHSTDSVNFLVSVLKNNP
ncbi:Olfactory receptor 2L13 [Sciurus carolinensis]|uniref:Olfactory receptor 2L13 n=1 Tax=Sciurus carolinensis TaxID=30640 RepID=A0AA41NET1_SCICA|nr:Olfactory receptor 2L13 [Sciurus carolinensis]